MANRPPQPKTKNTTINMIKVKTESNGLGLLKTLVVVGLIAIQTAFIVLSYTYLLNVFRFYGTFAIIVNIVACVHVLSSTANGQAKATWILFLLTCYTFGYVIYILSNEKVLFANSRKKYKKIYEKSKKYLKNSKNTAKNQKNGEFLNNLLPAHKRAVDYLTNYAFAPVRTNTKLKYFASGASFFDEVINRIKIAKKFIFMEFFIISDGVLLNRVIDILTQKVKEGVDVRIIYDDMGCHGKIKRKTKRQIKKAGIKFMHFNRLVPVFNIALNLRDHRKIVVVDGKVGFTGGTNLADEYINEKQIYGYWKDEGILLEGEAVDNLTIAFLRQWEFLTKDDIDYEKYINLFETFKSDSVAIPFISGPEFRYSVAKDMYVHIISSAEEKLNIMTPYFVTEETIINLLIAKAKSGVEVNLILPSIADKKFVYVVSRDYAERLISSGINVYTMNKSFVHSKVIANENSAIIGSINIDHRSFNQQFESAVYTNDSEVLSDVQLDFEETIEISTKITSETRKRNNIFYRIFAGLFRLVSPFM